MLSYVASIESENLISKSCETCHHFARSVFSILDLDATQKTLFYCALGSVKLTVRQVILEEMRKAASEVSLVCCKAKTSEIMEEFPLTAAAL